MTMDQLMRSVKSENSLPVEEKKEVIKHLFADFAIDPRILKNILLRFILPFFSSEIKQHYMVNNWANGWMLPMTSDQRPST